MATVEEERLRAEIDSHRLMPGGKLRRGSLTPQLAREMFRFQRRGKLSTRDVAERLRLSIGQYRYICRAFEAKRIHPRGRPRFRRIALQDDSGFSPVPASVIEIRAGELSFRVTSSEKALEIVRGLKQLSR